MKKYAVIFRSPNLGTCDAAFDGYGHRQYRRSCELHDGTRVFGETNGYPLWMAKIIARLLCFVDTRGYVFLREVNIMAKCRERTLN